MKHLIIFVFISAVFIYSACQDDTANEEQTKEETVSPEKTEAENLLEIQGDDIWIRDEPATGKVIMKLNTGDRCKILKKGKQQTINKSTDFWYKIEFNDEEGWVFGSQTSLSTGIASKISTPNSSAKQDALNQIIKSIQNNPQKITQWSLDANAFFLIHNPGAYTVIEYTSNTDRLNFLSAEKETCIIKHTKWPAFDYDSYTWKKSGCFAEKISGSKLFSSTAKTMKEFSMPISDDIINKAEQSEKQITIKVLLTQSSTRLYFSYSNNEWKIIGIDISDFSS
ncbi:MAG: SH3 domain-containing protein [Bacteroidota bacterium]|nr:SH3 domain-containing protein [Bacteroidota bacterium]